MQCEYQECTSQNATPRPSLTCYVNIDGIPTEELNPKPILCDEHWEEYAAYWTEMWDEYRASQGF